MGEKERLLGERHSVPIPSEVAEPEQVLSRAESFDRIEVCRRMMADSRNLLAITRELRRTSIELLWISGAIHPCMASTQPKHITRQSGRGADIGSILAGARRQVDGIRERVA